FSPDGKTVAIRGTKAIRLIDFATGKEQRVLAEGSAHLADMWQGGAVSWSPDSKRFAQECGPGGLRIWDLETGKCTDPGVGHVRPIMGFALSTDGKFAHTLGKDNTIRTWDVQTESEQRSASVPVDAHFVHLLRLNEILLHRKEGRVQIWDIDKKRE